MEPKCRGNLEGGNGATVSGQEWLWVDKSGRVAASGGQARKGDGAMVSEGGRGRKMARMGFRVLRETHRSA